MTDTKKYIGIDLGGTNITAGIVTEKCEILATASTKTNADRPQKDVIDDIAKTAKEAVIACGLTIGDMHAIGVGSPGAIDDDNGIVILSGNLNWKNVPLKSELEVRLGIPVFVSNDANVAALAESLLGAGKNKKSVFLITLGTGVGAGYIIDDKIQSRFHGVGAEFGHMIIQPEGITCTCGNKGCFERYASASALIAHGIDAMKAQPNERIAQMANFNQENLSAKIIIDLAKQGDKVAFGIFDDYCRYIAYGIVNIINLIDPEVIILGGGVSRAGDFLLNHVKVHVKPRIFCKQAPYSEIVLSDMGNKAGVVGAALLCI